MPNMTINRRYEIACAHHLHGLGPKHKCSRPHGHNYQIVLTCAGELVNGMVVDAGRIDVAVRPILRRLDHHDLNEFDDGTAAGKRLAAQPTAEHLALYLWERLMFLRIPDDTEGGNAPKRVVINMTKVRVYETANIWAEVSE